MHRLASRATDLPRTRLDARNQKQVDASRSRPPLT